MGSKWGVGKDSLFTINSFTIYYFSIACIIGWEPK